MGDLDKQLRKFKPKEKEVVEYLVKSIINRNLVGLNCKKLKGLRNLFRVRKGRIRIIFELEDKKEPNIISIEQRREDTYKF